MICQLVQCFLFFPISFWLSARLSVFSHSCLMDLWCAMDEKQAKKVKIAAGRSNFPMVNVNLRPLNINPNKPNVDDVVDDKNEDYRGKNWGPFQASWVSAVVVDNIWFGQQKYFVCVRCVCSQNQFVLPVLLSIGFWFEETEEIFFKENCFWLGPGFFYWNWTHGEHCAADQLSFFLSIESFWLTHSRFECVCWLGGAVAECFW